MSAVKRNAQTHVHPKAPSEAQLPEKDNEKVVTQ